MDTNCEKCGLYKYSETPCIQGKGVLDDTTNIFLIGEAPGPDESHKGQVFIGRAGKKLDSMLRPFRERLNIYITNTVKCYPPISTSNPKKGFRVPKMSEIELCRPKLLAELAQAPNCTLLMPLGNTALTTLLMDNKHEGITKAIGKFRPIKMDNGKVYTVLPNYHPSYIVRNNTRKPEFEKVLEQAVQFLNGDLTCLDYLQENNNE